MAASSWSAASSIFEPARPSSKEGEVIQMWPFAEAPEEYRDLPGLDEAMSGTTPVWLAHWPGPPEFNESADSALFHEFASLWTGTAGHTIFGKHLGNRGCVQAGCRLAEGGSQ